MSLNNLQQDKAVCQNKDNCPFNIPIALGAEKCYKYNDITQDAFRKIQEVIDNCEEQVNQD